MKFPVLWLSFACLWVGAEGAHHLNGCQNFNRGFHHQTQLRHRRPKELLSRKESLLREAFSVV